MSSLEWVETPHTSFTKPAVIAIYWELWAAGADKTVWYNLPCATIQKKRDKLWELTTSDPYNTYQYKTLKEAKAMGIALVTMEGIKHGI